MGKRGEFNDMQSLRISEQQLNSQFSKEATNNNNSAIQESQGQQQHSEFSHAQILSFKSNNSKWDNSALSLQSFETSKRFPHCNDGGLPQGKNFAKRCDHQNDKSQFNFKFQTPTKKAPTPEELTKIEKSISTKISSVRSKLIYLVVGLIKYIYFDLDLTKNGLLLNELILHKKLNKNHMFSQMIKSRICKYHKNMCDLLNKATSLSDIIRVFPNIEKFGDVIVKKLDSKSPFSYETPKEPFKIAILLDFGRQIVSGMILASLSVSKEMKLCFAAMGKKLGSMTGSDSSNSQHFSFISEINFSTVHDFKTALSDSGSNPLAKIYGLFN